MVVANIILLKLYLCNVLIKRNIYVSKFCFVEKNVYYYH